MHQLASASLLVQHVNLCDLQPSPSYMTGPARLEPSEPERFIHQDRDDTTRSDDFVDDKEIIYTAGHPVGLASPGVLKREAVLIYPSQSGAQIGDDLLTTGDKYHVARTGNDGTELAPAGRSEVR